MGTGDTLAIGTGILGIAAGKMLNKGLLIAYMVLGIICALWFAAAIPLFTAATVVCGAVNDVVDGACQNAAGEPYCCFACDVDTCGGAGCMWQGPYTDGYCHVPAGAPEVESPCDKNCCDDLNAGNPDIYWSSSENSATCAIGTDGRALSSAHGQGTCETDADVTSKDQCSVESDTYSNKQTELSAGATYANTGCHVDDADTGICEYTFLIWITIFVTLGLSIAGSVMGCCVVCCGNDQLSGGGDDSG
jgi:hypothetical protein